GGDAAGYVRALYRDLLNRIPQQNEVDYWVAQLGVGPRFNAQSRAAVALQFLRSNEIRNNLITEWFTEGLDREPTPAERLSILNLLRSGATLEQAQVAVLLLPQ